MSFLHPVGLTVTITTVVLVVGWWTLPVTPVPFQRSVKPFDQAIASSASAPVRPTFTDETLRAGLTGTHVQRGDELMGLDESLGPGACALDYDGDGWMDLLTIAGSGQTRYHGEREWWHSSPGLALYRNQRDGTFVEVTAASGLTRIDWGMGCTAADLDNDGDQDLVLANRGTNRLYRNDGNGHFEDVTPTAGLVGDEWSSSVAIADYDGDGLPDLYVVNYLQFVKGDKTYEAASGFKQDKGIAFTSGLYDGTRNRLYRNLGGLVFKDVTATAGVANAGGRSLDAAWLDINDDHRPDLLVSNAAGLPNALYINNGHGGFSDQAAHYGLQMATGSRGIGIGDLDGDQRADIVLATPMGHPLRAYTRTATGDPAGSDPFKDQARHLGLLDYGEGEHSGWGVVIEDFDLDGRLDVFTTQGVLDPDNLAPKLPIGQPNALWLQTGAGRFMPDPYFPRDVESSRGGISADFDNDGRPDLYVANNNALGQLLINGSASDSEPSHWLGLVLQGRHGNRDGIGARAWIDKAGETQTRFVYAGGFLSRGDRRLVFGLGAKTEPLRVSVQWPDGQQEVFADVPVDTYSVLVQGSGQAVASDSAKPVVPAPLPSYPRLTHDAVLRAAYLPLAVQHDGPQKMAGPLVAAATDRLPQVRLAVVQVLTRSQTESGLRLLPAFLSDDDPGIRAAATTGLIAYESELTVRWLLAMLDDPDPTVRCTAADGVGRWFDEEEAVVVQKYLAVPALIRFLDARNPRVRRCGARALGHSERYRAIAPLLDRLDDPDNGVRTAAIRALGLIRDRSAIDALTTVVRDQHQSLEVRAAGLVALRRLSYSDLDGLIQNMLADASLSREADSMGQALTLLQRVSRVGDDAIVISAREVQRAVITYFTAPDTSLPAGPGPLLSILESSPLTGSNGLLVSLTTDAQYPAEVRGRALAVVLRFTRGSDHAQALRAFDEAPSAEQNVTLASLVGHQTTLPTTHLLPLLDNPETFAAAAALVTRDSGKEVADALRSALKTDAASRTNTQAAVDALARIGRDAADLPIDIRDDPYYLPATLTIWAEHNDPRRFVAVMPAEIRLASVDFRQPVLMQLVQVLLSRSEPWALRTLAALLQNPKVPHAVRVMVLNGFASRTNTYTNRLLMELARHFHDPMSVAVMPALFDRDPRTASRLAKQRVLDVQESPATRTTLLAMLFTQAQDATLAWLRGAPTTNRTPPHGSH